MKKLKKLVISILVVSALVISSALVASAQMQKKQTAKTTPCGSGYVDWAFYSEGDDRYAKIDNFYWVYVTPFSGCTIVGKRAVRSSMDPDHWVIGYITAKYGAVTYLNDQKVVGHYYDVIRGDIILN